MIACGGGTGEDRNFTACTNCANPALSADTLRFTDLRFVFSALTLHRRQCYNSASKRGVY